jgi:hypothetical protein
MPEKKTELVEEPKKQETRGRKPEHITLTVNCFKKLCLKSRTGEIMFLSFSTSFNDLNLTQQKIKI